MHAFFPAGTAGTPVHQVKAHLLNAGVHFTTFKQRLIQFEQSGASPSKVERVRGVLLQKQKRYDLLQAKLSEVRQQQQQQPAGEVAEPRHSTHRSHAAAAAAAGEAATPTTAAGSSSSGPPSSGDVGVQHASPGGHCGVPPNLAAPAPPATKGAPAGSAPAGGPPAATVAGTATGRGSDPPATSSAECSPPLAAAAAAAPSLTLMQQRQMKEWQDPNYSAKRQALLADWRGGSFGAMAEVLGIACIMRLCNGCWCLNLGLYWEPVAPGDPSMPLAAAHKGVSFACRAFGHT